MTSVRIRPRFKSESNKSVEEIERSIKSKLDIGQDCVGHVTKGYATLKVPNTDRHFWSPQLGLTFEEEEGKTIVRGLYGPSPNIWAIFTFGYGALGVLGIFASMLGFSQITLDKTPWGLWVVIVLAILALILYLASQAGQKLGVEQTFRLHQVLEEVIDQKVHIG